MATVNFSEECQDKDGTARLCIPGLSSQKESTPRDDSSQDVFRGANMSAVDAVSRQVPIATTLGNKESALREADVREDCVNICEESLTYSSESLHKIVGTVGDFTVTLYGGRISGISFGSMK